ncbi:MAG: type II secretion system GspH family protein [Acidobacteriia bacterium]|nr:type II secretion system GspH family protein [Terriglobia bacterium]
MRRGLKLRNYQITNHKSQIRQRGYMMITLMLAVALISIGLLAVLPSIRQQIQRDRELELQHRGTAYMRAIQHFYKKFNRYPMRVEELESTNNLRFLRKRYTDPMNRDPQTGKERDFKLLHQQDISLNNGPVLGQIPGQGIPGGLAGGQGGFGGGMQGGLGGLGTQSGGLQQQGKTVTQTPAGDDSDKASNEEGASSPTGSSGSSSGSTSTSSSGFNGPTFGGGPILGVASMNKKTKSVRVFFDKSHYNDWLFIYVPTADMGGLLKGPVNPGAPAGNLNGMTPGQGVGGGIVPGQGVGQGLNPGQPPNPMTPPAQNPGQTPPEQ